MSPKRKSLYRPNWVAVLFGISRAYPEWKDNKGRTPFESWQRKCLDYGSQRIEQTKGKK